MSNPQKPDANSAEPAVKKSIFSQKCMKISAVVVLVSILLFGYSMNWFDRFFGKKEEKKKAKRGGGGGGGEQTQEFQELKGEFSLKVGQKCLAPHTGEPTMMEGALTFATDGSCPKFSQLASSLPYSYRKNEESPWTEADDSWFVKMF